MISIKEYVKRLGIRRACSAFGLARAVYYRYEAKAAAVLNSAVDQPPKAKRSSTGHQGPPDSNEIAYRVFQEAVHDEPETETVKNPNAVALGQLGGKVGGKARAASLTPEQRSEIARVAAQARWKKG